ncbi:MAG: TonB-dependent receptor domain-containing protein [Ignavibacteriales bacterium]
MRLFTRLTLFFYFFAIFSVFAQSDKNNPDGAISGKLIDAQTGKPVEYASVVLFDAANRKQISGAVSNAKGNFGISELKPGRYFIEISFIGYEKKRINDVVISSSEPLLELGEIKVEQKAVMMDNVVIEGQRVPFSYQIDKKVINVDKFSTAISGTAVDILENIPSVSVDIEGNVSLRGSGSFTVLIDGRPTIMDPQDALQQIPASSIENIEIITNPSVKYDPEGVAGIINLVLKKNENLGLSGVTNLSAGLNDKYSGDMLLDYKQTGFNTIFGLDYRKRNMTETSSEEKIYNYQGNFSRIQSSGNGKRGRDGFGLRANINFSLWENGILGFGARYHNRKMIGNMSSDYSEYSGNFPLGDFYINRNESNRSGDSYSLSMNFQHKFETKGHELTADLSYEKEKGDDASISELLRGQTITSGKKTTEGGPAGEFNTKIDYTLPLGAQAKFESGLEGQSEFADENTSYHTYSSLTSSYVLQPEFSFSTKSRNDEYSVYSVYSNMISNFGFQLGVRGEYTYRKIEIPAKNNIFNIDRWDYFPTLHLSYKLAGDQQFIASYSKRIQRPRNWTLEPFDTWVDANTVHRGNPSLRPELIDSYELGFQTLIGIVSFSSEVYYRVNNSKISGVRSVYSDNVTLETYENIGSDYSLGTELMASTELFKFWSIDMMGNLYDYRLKSNLNGETSTRKSFNWRSRMSNSLKFTSSLSLQLNADYNSPSVSYQDRTEGTFTLDLAVKKEFMDRQISLTLQVRDLLRTHRHKSTTESAGYYSYSNHFGESPMLMLNLRYSINNFKQERQREPNGDEFNNDEG